MLIVPFFRNITTQRLPECEDVMQTARHYSRAPITEAIIDLRVTLPDGFSVDDLADIHPDIIDRFPTKEPIHTGSLLFQTGPSIKIDASKEHHGFLFRSEDGLRIFQATLSGFTFNRLAQYDTWEEFSSDARHLWEIYMRICQPSSVTRAAVRFINRLDLPGPALDFKDYLRTVPEVSTDLPQGLSAYFMQLQIPQEDLNCMLIINEAFTPPTSPELVSVILDFDLFREHNWQSDDEDIWRFLEKLRHRKNLAFEASITDKTRRLID
jgi:uncharacterized protein (TIGR04255 family)